MVFFIAFGTAPMAFDVSAGTGVAIGPFLALAIAGPLALARSQPLLAWVTGTAAAVVIPLLLAPTWITPWPWPVIHGLVLFVLLFVVTAAERLWIGVIAVFVSTLVWGFGVREGQAPWVFAVVVVGLSGVLTGRLVRSRRALRRERELTLSEQASRVVLQERARIARDLHDIVAHHMSLVVVQAETARYRIPDLPESVLAELDSISSTAREALTETRALLSVLRGGDDEAAHAPQPGLAQIGDLVDGARRAGMTLTESVDCPDDGVRPGTQLALYRIVQESLANAARHAPGAPVRLTISRRPDGILLQVRNAAASPEPGGPEPPAGPVGVGHGLTGMRERVAAEGGTIECGETSDGGFRVTVHLPLSPGDPVPGAPGASTAGEAGTPDSVVTRQQPLRSGPVPAAATRPPTGDEG